MAIRNRLIDMHNILFEQLERLNDDELSDEELDKEIKRGGAICEISKTIIDNANTLLKAQKYYETEGHPDNQPRIMELSDSKE